MRSPIRSASLLLITFVAFAACKKDEPPSSTGTPPGSTASPQKTAAPPATSAASAPAKPGACTFTGTWTGNYPPGPYPFSGTQFEFTFNADGTGVTKSQRADQEFAWKTEGNVFAIHGVKVEQGGRYTCSKEQVGKWSYTFTPDCNTVTFKVVEDPCVGRAKQADGASMKRK